MPVSRFAKPVTQCRVSDTFGSCNEAKIHVNANCLPTDACQIDIILQDFVNTTAATNAQNSAMCTNLPTGLM